MQRGGISYLITGTLLIAFFCTLAGLEAFSQSQAAAADNGSQILANRKNAVMMMRKLANAEIKYREGSEDSEFGTVSDLFRHDHIDADLADALGCPKMTSAKGKICPGTHAPLRGYLYRLEITRPISAETAEYRIVGIPAAEPGEPQTGMCTYYVDQTHVIRTSDDPAVEAGPQSPPIGTPKAPEICQWWVWDLVKKYF
jgi:hypothetical protein